MFAHQLHTEFPDKVLNIIEWGLPNKQYTMFGKLTKRFHMTVLNSENASSASSHNVDGTCFFSTLNNTAFCRKRMYIKMF